MTLAPSWSLRRVVTIAMVSALLAATMVEMEAVDTRSGKLGRSCRLLKRIAPKLCDNLHNQKNNMEQNNAEEARWLVRSTSWSTLSYIAADSRVTSRIVPHTAQSDGKVRITLPRGLPEGQLTGASLTMSETQLHDNHHNNATTSTTDNSCGDKGTLDPEDPRCAKLTLSGSFYVVKEDDNINELRNQLYLHLEQTVLELNLTEVWMIANYGGGGTVSTDAYYAAQPKHHAGGFPITTSTAVTRRRRTSLLNDSSDTPTLSSIAGQARYVVSSSRWTTVSTNASPRFVQAHNSSQAWGNVRSTHDGECLGSSLGLPVFYLPTPDPTARDLSLHPAVSLSFGAGAAQVTLRGRARVLTPDERPYVLRAFATTHPHASWLAQGGAHTGGDYYTLDLEAVEYYDVTGPVLTTTSRDIEVKEYLAWTPSDEKTTTLPADLLNCVKRADVKKKEQEQDNKGGSTDPNSHDSDTHGHEDGTGGGHGDGSGGGHGDGSGHHHHGDSDSHGSGTPGHGKWGGHGDHTGHGDGSGGGRGDGSGWWNRSKGGSEKQQQHADTKGSATAVKDESSSFHFATFVWGAVFGFMVWGPAVVMIVFYSYVTNANHGIGGGGIVSNAPNMGIAGAELTTPLITPPNSNHGEVEVV